MTRKCHKKGVKVGEVILTEVAFVVKSPMGGSEARALGARKRERWCGKYVKAGAAEDCQLTARRGRACPESPEELLESR